VFYGTYQHIIDNKGRLIIPAKFRSQLGERFVIARIFDKCLWVFPQANWQNLEDKLKSLPITSHKARSFSRYVFSTVEIAECDRAGRVLIPSALREYANLKEEVVIVGCGAHIEIWDKKTWDLLPEEYEEKYDSFSEDFKELEFR
jgi:MraZ protein